MGTRALTAIVAVIGLAASVLLADCAAPAYAQKPVASGDATEKGTGQYELLARQGFRLSQEDAASIEQSLAKTPDDFDARARLMGFYFAAGLRSIGPQATIAARRRHILWLLAHHPDSPLLDTPEATLDPAGHGLADPEGYEQVKKAWLELTAKSDASAAVLGNAGHFFHLTDKALAIKFYSRARRIEPRSGKWLVGQGEAMAFAVVGVMAMNQNGFPGPADSTAANSDFARGVQAMLETSNDPALLTFVAAQLSTRGFMAQVMARRMTQAKPPVDALDLAETLYKRAATLGPCKPACNFGLANIFKTREMLATSEAEKSALAHARYQELAAATEGMPEDDPANTRQLLDLAGAALDAGDLDRAEALAKNLLALVPKMQQELARAPAEAAQGAESVKWSNLRWGIDQIWHHGHLLLGRVALRRGDIVAAKADLLEAARLPIGKNFSPFGPNMALAKELLEKGEKETVLQYFDLCRKFWTYRGASTLDAWSAAVRRGEMPNFGGNLTY